MCLLLVSNKCLGDVKLSDIIFVELVSNTPFPQYFSSLSFLATIHDSGLSLGINDLNFPARLFYPFEMIALEVYTTSVSNNQVSKHECVMNKVCPSIIMVLCFLPVKVMLLYLSLCH